MRYIAKDLAEIAAAFDKRAESATRYAENASTVAERRTAEAEARVWAEGAQFLRDTEIRAERSH